MVTFQLPVRVYEALVYGDKHKDLYRRLVVYGHPQRSRTWGVAMTPYTSAQARLGAQEVLEEIKQAFRRNRGH